MRRSDIAREAGAIDQATGSQVRQSFPNVPEREMSIGSRSAAPTGAHGRPVPIALGLGRVSALMGSSAREPQVIETDPRWMEDGRHDRPRLNPGSRSRPQRRPLRAAAGASGTDPPGQPARDCRLRQALSRILAQPAQQSRTARPKTPAPTSACARRARRPSASSSTTRWRWAAPAPAIRGRDRRR